MLVELQQRVSHYRWRCVVRRERRRKLRQTRAKERDKKLEEEQAALLADPEYVKELEEHQRLEEIAQQLAEEEAARQREEWQLRDAALHSKFLREKEKLRLAEEARQRQEELIKKEWEEKLKKEKEEEEKKNDEQRALLEAATENLGKDGDGPTHNPEPPENYRGREQTEREPCPFYTKTGSCRFGVYCSREHSFPSVSDTLMIPNMYSHFGMEKVALDEYDNDASLEYSEQETYEHFRDFYNDTLPEFKRCGSVLQFKVCCNASAHLRGNLYVKYTNEAEAMKAHDLFHGRWYAGRQLNCIYVKITKWKAALCKLFQRNRKGCPKGGQCNFIHAFHNPGNEFWRADLDLPLCGPVYDYRASPKRSSERSERSRRRSRSRTRSMRSIHKSRSRSPDNKGSHRSSQTSCKSRNNRTRRSREKSSSRDVKSNRRGRSKSGSMSPVHIKIRSRSPKDYKPGIRHKSDYRSQRCYRSRSRSKSPKHSKRSRKSQRSRSHDRSSKSNGSY